jgi:tetratricopeptide (TPR) repeat protein
LAWLVIILPCAGADWLRIGTPQIEILTDSGERAGKATLSRLEQIRGVFVTRDNRPLPLRVFLFASENEFRSYTDKAITGGFYQGGAERDFIVLHSGTGLTRAVTHEYIHLIMDRSVGPLPLWFEEGTAELYSNLDFQRGSMIAGEPIQEHLSTLAAQRWLVADQLMAATQRSPLYNEQTLAGVFYAESWALMHMLNLAPAWRDRMPRFAELLASGQDGNEVFAEVFGKTMEQALVELRGYVGRLRGARVEAPLERETVAITVDSLKRIEATLARADLALNVRHLESARDLFESAKKLYPDSADAEAGMGALALAEDKRDEARVHLERAIAMGARDAGTYFQLAMLERDAHASAARVTDLLNRAIDLDPNFGEAHFLLGLQATDDGEYEMAIDHLRAAARALPRRSYVWHALGYAEAMVGRVTEARISASRAARTARTQQEESMADALLDSLR